MKQLLIFIFMGTFVISSSLNEDEISLFIESRYAGDDSTVYSMISEDFKYYHTPYIGLGIFTEYVDGSLLVTGIVDDSLQTMLSVGDRISEINGKVVSIESPTITGKEKDVQSLIVTRDGDSTFTELNIPLIQVQYYQNDSLFLFDMKTYADQWSEFHVDILDIVFEKEKASVYYHWEGSKTENGQVFHFYAMEMIHINKKTDLIYKVEGLWSEKQFRDQFK